ncbi:MAG: gephyrin-like molybdotransferase Glp [Verrucomicrobiota bacterium]
MLEESEARHRILASVGSGAVVWVPIELALDQVLAEPMEGLVDSPPFDNSSMDGYAVFANEAVDGAELTVHSQEQPAGRNLHLRLESGEAIRIFTGAPIPEGTDAVIMQEDVEREGAVIRILEGVEVGENIRRQGGDVCAGQKILNQGDQITPSRIGLLASQGYSELPVYRRPLVQIVTTGDELVPAGEPLNPGEIYNSNGPMLEACVARVGAVGASSHAVDDRDSLRETLSHAISVSDLVVVAGGVSVGEKDFVREVLESLGVETDFWRVRVKPGKPFLFGRHDDGTPVFGLPGNPVSAFVTFQRFVAPVIKVMLGFSVDDAEGTVIEGIADEEICNRGDRPHYLRGIAEGGRIRLSGTQQSHAIFGLSKANCLIRLEPQMVIPTGAKARAILF